MPLGAAAADDQGLFATTDQNTFIQLYSVPSPALYPAPGKGAWAGRVELDVANNAISEALPSGEAVVLDGETYRTSLSLSHGLSERVAIGLTLPFVAHSGGFLDAGVRNWHDLFGMSNSRRDEFVDNSLEYSYAASAGEVVQVTGHSRGLGDLRLTLESQLGPPDSPRRLALRGGLKLPTGSSEHLHGSGSTDVSVQLLAIDDVSLGAWNTTVAWTVGGLWLGEGDVLDELRRDFVAIGSIGLSWPVSPTVTARLQLDGHSSFYDTDLRPLGPATFQLAFGGSIALPGAGRIDLAMTENLVTDATPDLGLHIAWRGVF